MQIYVLTRGRINQQVTRRCAFLDRISEIWPVTYILPECDVREYCKVYPHTLFLTVPNYFTSGDIRQFAMDHSLTTGDPFQIHLDDDMYMFRRKHRAPLLDKADTQDMIDLFHYIKSTLKEGIYKHGGVSAREGNNRIEEDRKENTRAMRFLFYDVRPIFEHGIKFTDVMCRMDFHMTLSLLEKGYPNVVLYEWAQNQLESSIRARAGGADHYRTMEMMNEQTEQLRQLHPEFIKVVDKETLVSFGGKERKDVVIQWKKAYKSS